MTYIFFFSNVGPCHLRFQALHSFSCTQCCLRSLVTILRIFDRSLQIGKYLPLCLENFEGLADIFETSFVFLAKLLELSAFQEELGKSIVNDNMFILKESLYLIFVCGVRHAQKLSSGIWTDSKIQNIDRDSTL